MRSKASFPFPFAILSLFFKSVILWCVIKYCHQAKSCKTHFKQEGKKKPNSVSYQSLGTVQCYQYRRIYGWVSQRHQLSVQWSEVDQSCPTLCDPMGCSLPGSFVHGIFQAIVLEWLAISFFIIAHLQVPIPSSLPSPEAQGFPTLAHRRWLRGRDRNLPFVKCGPCLNQ